MPRDSHKNALFEPDTTFWENLLSVFLCAGVKLTMKLSTAAAALTSLCLACGPAKAESAKRLADLLTRDNFSPDGLLASKTIASFEGCVLHLTVDKLDACSRGASFEMREEILDVRMLNSGSEDVRVRKVGEGYTALSEVSLSYSYKWLYGKFLKRANDTSSRIFEEEYARYPADVDARLRSLSKRYREEIEPEYYSKSMETTTFCSGVEINQPLDDYSFSFYLPPENAEEFIDLLENHASNCESDVNS